MLQEGQQYSRLALILNIVIYILLTYLVRELWKHLLRKEMEDGENRSLLLVVSADVVSAVVESMKEHNYNCAIAACDDGTKRLEWNKKLETLYNIPVLFHMDSTISPSANLMPGCIVEPRAVVGCGSTIGQATVVGANAVVEPYCFVGDSCTLKSGTIVKSTSVLEMGTETEQGTQISIEQSLLQSGAAISLYSTVLNQALCNSIPIIIDNMSNPENFNKLKELGYVCLYKEHRLLSEVLEKSV